MNSSDKIVDEMSPEKVRSLYKHVLKESKTKPVLFIVTTYTNESDYFLLIQAVQTIQQNDNSKVAENCFSEIALI